MAHSFVSLEDVTRKRLMLLTTLQDVIWLGATCSVTSLSLRWNRLRKPFWPSLKEFLNMETRMADC